MQIEAVREYDNGDGTVTLDFDLDDEATTALIRIGLMTCIKKGLEVTKEMYDYSTD